VKPYTQHFFIGFLKDIPVQFLGRNAFLADLNLVFAQQVIAIGYPSSGRTGRQKKENGHDQEKKSFMPASFGEKNSVHPELRLNILLKSGFHVPYIFVPSHKDNFNPYKSCAFFHKIVHALFQIDKNAK